jgi:predicted XRE-type DNA-binding protein
MMEIKITQGNVFKDLGFSDEEAVALAMRVDLAVEIEKFVRRKKLTQTRAAKYFGIPQPKISKILRGKIDEFSIDYLVKIVAKTGRTPHVSFTSKKAA